jgi:hypothetical protein
MKMVRNIRSLCHDRVPQLFAGSVRLLAATLLLAGFTGVGPARGQGVTWDGFDPNDPIRSIVLRLHERMVERCGVGQRQVVLGMASAFANQTTGLNQDQQLHVISLVHAAFSNMPHVEIESFVDVGSASAAQRSGTYALTPQEIEQRNRRVDIWITPSGFLRTTNTFLMKLNASSRDGRCNVYTDEAPVAGHLVGEVYDTLDNVLINTVKELRKTARGTNQVAMEAVSVTGDPIPATYHDHFVREMRKAVTSTSAQQVQIIGNETKIFVDRRGQPEKPGAVLWEGKVAIEERPTGTRVNVDLQTAEQEPIAKGAVLPPRSLPAVSRASFVGGNQRGALARLELRSTPLRIADLVSDGTPQQRYEFTLSQPSLVEVDAQSGGAHSPSFNPVLLDRNGREVANINPVNPNGRRPNLRRFRVERGDYRLTVSSPSRGAHEFTLSTRAVPVTEMFAPEPPGRLLNQFQDWYVGEFSIGGHRECYAFTPALGVAPLGWREQAPVIWMSVPEKPGEPLSHYLDLGERFDQRSPMVMRVRTPTGLESRSVAVLGRHISPVQQGSDGSPILSPDAIRSYTRGSQLELHGRSSDGHAAQVRYSLLGYRSAASAMALACNRVDFARDLVWR